MAKHLIALASGAALGLVLTFAPASAQALKGPDTCLDEYKANKPALRAAKEKKGDFIAACRALQPGVPTPIRGTAPASPGVPAGRASDVGAYKTAGQCNDEYKAAKAALKAAGEKKRDFVAACRSLPPGSPTPINGAVAAPSPTPTATAPAPSPTPAPAPSAVPAPAPAASQASRPSAAAAPGASACNNGYAHLPTSHTAVQFCTDQEAKNRCPGAPVVWVNTKSKVYHYAGTSFYGHTKEGAYMCESDATGEGDRGPAAHGH